MKKILLAALLAFPAMLTAAGDEPCCRPFYGFSLSYVSAVSPPGLENNGTGVYDFAAPSAKAGVRLSGIADVYAGALFMLFIDRADAEKHFSFLPVFGGISLAAPKLIFIKASAHFEAGTSFSNEHTKVSGFSADYPWNGFYYNAGAALEFELSSVLSLTLSVDRPAISGRDGGEIHVMRSGAGWKVCM